MFGKLRSAKIAMMAAGLGIAACSPQSAKGSDASPAQGAVDAAAQAAMKQCPAHGVALQVLGSGGPIAEAARAGTSYLLWVDGKARLLIDFGSGAFLRFAEAGGDFNTLDGVLLTHLHADHVGDLAGLLKYGGFTTRSADLPIIGPDAAPRFPSTREFLETNLAKEGGAYAYLGGYLDGSEGKVSLQARNIETAFGKGEAVEISLADDLVVRAIPVHHGVVPALGYEILAGGKKIVITGDQSAQSTGFAQLLSDSRPDALFAHHVINGQPGQPRGLHRTPGQIGELAASIKPGQLVLTHNMQRALDHWDDGQRAIAENYAGKVSIADDLTCYKF